MADEPGLIPGIYIYCDRWCERCAFTSRCLQFRIEAEDLERGNALQNFDAMNLKFWQEMGKALVQAMRLIREIAAKEGIAPYDLQKETVFSEPPESLQRDAREHPCANAALFYAGMVNEWFAAVDELSDVVALNESERSVEIARMLSGQEESASAQEHARELLEMVRESVIS